MQPEAQIALGGICGASLLNLSNSIDKRIGSKIRSCRIDLDLSVEQLAALLTVPLIQIMLWEEGINRIGGPYLVGIARILGVGPGFFFEDFKPPTMH